MSPHCAWGQKPAGQAEGWKLAFWRHNLISNLVLTSHVARTTVGPLGPAQACPNFICPRCSPFWCSRDQSPQTHHDPSQLGIRSPRTLDRKVSKFRRF